MEFRVAERPPESESDAEAKARPPVVEPVAHDPACVLATRLASAAIAIRRAEPALLRAQAMLLAWLSEKHRTDALSFGSVRAYAREQLGLEAGTVRNRLALHRILAACPAAEEWFLGGKVSACQILALRPVLLREKAWTEDGVEEAIDHDAWLAGAAKTPVSVLRQQVKRWQEAYRVDEEDLDPDGRTFSFTHPRTFGLIWETVMEQGRQVLGFEAPQWKVIEAVLAETGYGGRGGDPEADAGSAAGPAPEREASDAAGYWRSGARGGVSAGRCPCGSRDGQSAKTRLPGRGPAERTLAEVTKYLEDLADIAAPGRPTSPLDAHVRLLQIRSLLAPLDLYLGRLLRHIRDTESLRRLGYPHMKTFLTESLHLSERTARQKISEAILFEDRPALAQAYAGGRIGLSAAHRIGRLAAGRDLGALIDRAAEITTRQQQREYRLMFNLRLLARRIGRRWGHAVLPQPGLETALREALRKTRCSRKQMNRFFHARGIAPKRSGESTDPAENQALMARLEWMVEQLLAVDFEDPPDPVEELPAEERQTFALLPSIQGTGRTSVWLPEQVRGDLEAAVEEIRAKKRVEEEAAGEVEPSPYPVWMVLLSLFVEASRVWRQVDPQRRPRWAAVLERDRWRCQAPGCRCRCRLEVHHIVFRSRGGKNRKHNLIALCASCHRRLIHDGCLILNGEAPANLRWMLGARLPGGPLMVLKGERIVWRRELIEERAE
ncbi:MAG: hypothetical protein GF346_01745 [Candidatus Eisenbacteria bacterium]|nr:hypothetical protein [Candidatus Latescibacterota bacterium]MBD3301154.1 hypothetical protein [Candidatus Eisenbacteria bacterium]